MPRLFHVSSSMNRDSIEQFGIDWRRMGTACGIAGSSRPELAGVFLCRDEFEVDFFCRMDAVEGTVDVWAVEIASEADLVESESGFAYLPAVVPASAVALLQCGRATGHSGATYEDPTAYGSTLTIWFDDGRVERRSGR